MSNEERQQPADSAERERADPAAERSGSARRRFMRGAGAGSVVALSLLARPAWARNCSYSGRMSGNLSAQDDEPCGGEGRSPGYWKNHAIEWHDQWPTSMLFYDAFGVDAFPGRTLGEVIWAENGLSVPEDGDARYVNMLTQLGVQAVAALQNAATPVSYLMTVAEVVESFRQAYSTGDAARMEITKNSFDQLNNLSA